MQSCYYIDKIDLAEIKSFPHWFICCPSTCVVGIPFLEMRYLLPLLSFSYQQTFLPYRKCFRHYQGRSLMRNAHVLDVFAEWVLEIVSAVCPRANLESWKQEGTLLQSRSTDHTQGFILTCHRSLLHQVQAMCLLCIAVVLRVTFLELRGQLLNLHVTCFCCQFPYSDLGNFDSFLWSFYHTYRFSP